MDSYEIKYWIQKKDGYWEQRKDIICINGKSKHNKVEKLWKDNHVKDNVKIIATIYQ